MSLKRSMGTSEGAFVPLTGLECAASSISVLAIELPTHSSKRSTETTILLLSPKTSQNPILMVINKQAKLA